MKFLSKALILHHKNKKRVQKEIEFIRALRHPHIIKLFVFASCLPREYPTNLYSLRQI